MKRFFKLKNVAILLLLIAVLLMAILGEKFYDRMVREGMENNLPQVNVNGENVEYENDVTSSSNDENSGVDKNLQKDIVDIANKMADAKKDGNTPLEEELKVELKALLKESNLNQNSDSKNANVADYTNYLNNNIKKNDDLLDIENDKYMLKSHVVPPVCPKCPDLVLNAKELRKKMKESCPPCPPCSRCPEPSFDCKKVPNYSSSNVGNYLPKPMLTDFSNFRI